MSRPKRILVLFGVLMLLLLSKSTASAQQNFTNTWYDPSFEQFAAKVFDDRNPGEIFGERYTYAQVNWIMHSLRAFGYGSQINNCIAKPQATGNTSDILSCIAAINQPSTDAQSGGRDNGPVLGLASVGDALLNFRAASGVKYVADTAANFHIIPEAKAQGFGYGTLSPIQDLWKVIRNISFILLTILFIVMAFMIMFRVKISPQATVTIQSAIPKMVVTLIVIVFSYAIAGFIIDLAFVFTGIVALFIKSAEPGITAYDLPTFFNVIRGLINPIFSIFLGLLLASILPSILIGAAGGILAPVSFTLAIIVFVVALAIFAFRIIWLLLMTAIRLVLYTIFAPIILLTNMLPNANTLGSWIKSVAGSAMVYPVVILMVFLSHFFFWRMFLIPTSPDAANILDTFDTYNLSNSSLASPSSGYISFPGFEGTSQLIGLLLAFGVLGLVPSTANMIRSMIEGRAFDLESAIKGTYQGAFTPGGLYALGRAFNIAEESAARRGKRTPAYVQAGRRIFGLKAN